MQIMMADTVINSFDGFGSIFLKFTEEFDFGDKINAGFS